MAKKDLKNIYDKVFEEIMVNPQIQGLEKGLLYKIIQTILIEEDFNSNQEKTRAICTPLNIKPSAPKKDDKKIIADLVDVMFVEIQALAGIQKVIEVLKNKVIEVLKNLDISRKSVSVDQKITNEEANMKWFVITACTLVGVYFCIKYLEKTQQQKEKKKQSSRENPVSSPPSRPIRAALCFVVPAKTVYGLQAGSILTKENVLQIAENIFYFNCTTVNEAKLNEEQLILTDDEIKPDSQREVYIKIETDNGRDLISAETAFTLKRNLPTDSQFVVTRLVCLKNLSGLEVFTRI